MDGRTLEFDAREGRFHNKIEVSVVAADPSAKVRDTDRQELNLTLKPETRDRVRSGGVRVLSRLDVPPGRYQIRVGVHETVGGRVSTVPYDLEVPDYSKSEFTLSGLALTSTGAASLLTPTPDAQLKEIFPVPPVASRAFTRDERLGVFVELYDAIRPAHTVDLTTTITSLDADDQRPRFSSQDSRTMEAGTTARTHGFKSEIALRDLAPGRYLLRVEATSRFDERTVSREVPFEVRDAAAPITH